MNSCTYRIGCVASLFIILRKADVSMPNTHLATYLNDHLAGATGALELLTHLEEAYADTAVGAALIQLHAEISGERRELEQLMQRLDIAVSVPRKVSGWLGEKLAYVKLQLDDTSNGSMRLFEGLEALALGIRGKWGLWRALAVVSATEPGLQGITYEQLIQQSEDQHRRVEQMRLDAAKAALAATH
jgi:hypothetical protein